MSDEEIKFEKEKKSIRLNWIFITICVALVVAVASSEYTIRFYLNKPLDKAESSEDPNENIDIISDSLKNFRKVIDSVYLGDIDEQKMLDETLKGYVKGLGDEYSEYFTKSEWEDYQADTLGNYVGIGVYMAVDNNNSVVVVAPIEGSPAEAAGILAGDVIAGVDDENVLGQFTDEVSKKIKGEEGTKVKITVLRNKTEYLDFEIERKAIKIYHVKSEMKEDNVGYIQLSSFDEGCADEFKNAVLDLKNKGAKKIIIDLRSNTGGLVTEALKIIDLFAPKDSTMLITMDSNGNKKYSKAESDPIISCPIVVLVNEYSASASEITTGALRDLVGAKVVGKQTYGKGVIQNVYQLSDGSALKVTVSEYLTPNETKINKIGISPDFEAEYNSEEPVDAQIQKGIEVIKTLEK